MYENPFENGARDVPVSLRDEQDREPKDPDWTGLPLDDVRDPEGEPLGSTGLVLGPPVASSGQRGG